LLLIGGLTYQHRRRLIALGGMERERNRKTLTATHEVGTEEKVIEVGGEGIKWDVNPRALRWIARCTKLKLQEKGGDDNARAPKKKRKPPPPPYPSTLTFTSPAMSFSLLDLPHHHNHEAYLAPTAPPLLYKVEVREVGVKVRGKDLCTTGVKVVEVAFEKGEKTREKGGGLSDD
jgi:hypothetical protein